VPRLHPFDDLFSHGAFGAERKDAKPVRDHANDLTAALDFLMTNLREHMSDYHHRTDAGRLKRCEEMLRKGIAELEAHKGRDARPGVFSRWRSARTK
jgi:hypothetical protein